MSFHEHDIPFQKRLRQEIAIWLEEGLISREQKENILARYRVLQEADEKAGPGKLVTTISVLGAVLVGIGIRPISVSRTVPAGGKFIQGRTGYEQQASMWEVQLQDDNGASETFEPRWFSGVSKGDRVTFCVAENNSILRFYREDASYKPKCDIGKTVSGVIADIKETKSRQLRVEYGIENYFVEEGKGRAIEAARNARNLRVEVSLRKDGKGIITGLFLDNKLLR